MNADGSTLLARVAAVLYAAVVIELSLACSRAPWGWLSVALTALFAMVALAAVVSVFHRPAFAWVRGCAIAHAIGFVGCFGMLVDDLGYHVTGSDLASLSGINFAVPLLVAAIAHRQIRRPHILDLLYQEEAATEKARRFTFGEGIVLTLGALFAIVFVLIGGPAGQLFFAVYVAPVVFGGLLLFYLIRTLIRERKGRENKGPVILAARRVKLGSRLRKPSHIRHHWTANPAPPRDSYRDG